MVFNQAGECKYGVWAAKGKPVIRDLSIFMIWGGAEDLQGGYTFSLSILREGACNVSANFKWNLHFFNIMTGSMTLKQDYI